jgi:O-antigen ligase
MGKGAIAFLAVFALLVIFAIPNVWLGYVGYAAVSILCPQWNWRWELPGIEFQKWIAGATIIAFLVSGLRVQKLNAYSKFALLGFSTYVFLVFLSSLQVPDEEKAIRYWDNTWKIWVMTMIGCFVVDTRKKLNLLVWACIIAQGWNAWNVNQLYLQRGFINVLWFTWNFLDNNTYSISTIPVLAISFSTVVCSVKSWERLVAGIVALLQIHQLMILQSRGTMLGAAALFVIGFFFMPKSKATIAILGCIVGVGAMVAGPFVIEEFLSSFKQGEELDSSANSRYKLWSAGAAIIMDYPFLGVGPWVGEKYVPTYYDGYSEGRAYKALHNLLFEVGTGCGLPALIAYLVFFAFPWYGHLRLWMKDRLKMDVFSRRFNLAVLCGVPGYWVASMFSSGALIESPYVLMVIGCVSLSLIEEAFREDDTDDPVRFEVGSEREDIVCDSHAAKIAMEI